MLSINFDSVISFDLHTNLNVHHVQIFSTFTNANIKHKLLKTSPNIQRTKIVRAKQQTLLNTKVNQAINVIYRD